jgi:hypothetical protein
VEDFRDNPLAGNRSVCFEPCVDDCDSADTTRRVCVCVTRRRYEFVYLSPVGDLPLPAVDKSSLLGTNANAVMSVIEEGSLADAFLDPIPADLFTSAYGCCCCQRWC